VTNSAVFFICSTVFSKECCMENVALYMSFVRCSPIQILKDKHIESIVK